MKMRCLFMVAALILMIGKNSTAYSHKAQLPVTLYMDGKEYMEKAYYSPSCWMGDVKTILLNMKYDRDTYEGQYCIQLRTDPKKEQVFGWAGINWVFPPYNRANIDAGLDLSEARRIVFWARGEYGGETIIVKSGGNYGVYSDSDEIVDGPITLSEKWTLYGISLENCDLSHIGCGFGVIIRQRDNHKFDKSRVTIYLDSIFIE